MDYREVVEAAGGIYRGEMQYEVCDVHMVLFDGPHNGSTMALYADEIKGPESILEHIERQRVRWQVLNQYYDAQGRLG